MDDSVFGNLGPAGFEMVVSGFELDLDGFDGFELLAVPSQPSWKGSSGL